MVPVSKSLPLPPELQLKADHGAADHQQVVVGWPHRPALREGDPVPGGDVSEAASLRIVLGQRAGPQVGVLNTVFSSEESLLKKLWMKKQVLARKDGSVPVPVLYRYFGQI